jgi:UDP-N-acetylglucosamine--N-acetylmuramyl-(pentapeptide) pyrophosphoryl-undecaprenol N-acetylglucosamine transferase
MEKSVHIVLTGGGTAGHVVPHLAMIPHFVSRGWKISYIGGNVFEKNILRNYSAVTFYSVRTGKLRRYFSWENFVDPFKIIYGCLQSLWLLFKIKPNIVFSKGGFVSVPVVFSAWLLRIPIVTHESDVTPGLATKIIKIFCTKVFYSFPQSKIFFSSSKSLLTGIPIRSELFHGSIEKAESLTKLSKADSRPVLLIMGGSQGAKAINDFIHANRQNFLQHYQIVHITGKGKVRSDLGCPGYWQTEYVSEGLADLMALADCVVSRAGASSIFEFHALKKPMVLIPLVKGSRGDQVINAQMFVQNSWAQVLEENSLNPGVFVKTIEKSLTLRGKKSSTDSQLQEDPGIFILNTLSEIVSSKINRQKGI